MSRLGNARNWLDERLGWDDLIGPLHKKTVPLHRLSYWYFLGGITLFLFVIQVLTGILLLLYYRPGANEAFESVQYIMTQVQFGWLIRSIHSWSANLMIFTAFAHMFSVLFLKAYRKPRELTWVTGMILLFLVMGFGFSGYLLPWNTLAFFATKVGTEITGQVPILGKPLMVWYVALGVLGALAAIFPWNLGVKADPFAPAPAGIKPEWYFLFMFQTLKLIPPKVWFIDGEVVGILAFGAVALTFLVLPFFD